MSFLSSFAHQMTQFLPFDIGAARPPAPPNGYFELSNRSNYGGYTTSRNYVSNSQPNVSGKLCVTKT